MNKRKVIPRKKRQIQDKHIENAKRSTCIVYMGDSLQKDEFGKTEDIVNVLKY